MASFITNIPWFAWPLCIIYAIQLTIIIIGMLFSGNHQNDTDDMADKFLR